MRREFPKSVKVAVIKRATRFGTGETAGRVVYCECCALPAKRFQIDHVRADSLYGEPTLENAQLLCETCWREKNPRDTRDIAEAKRREAAHLGARPAPARPMQSRPFQKTQAALDRAAVKKLPLPGPRQIFEREP